MTIKLAGENGNPRGKIQDYNFPDKGVAGVEYSFSIVVQNIGGEGVYGCGVVNAIGNPGLIKIIFEDREIIIDQGKYLRSSKVGAYGTGFTISRKILFSVPGTYTIPLWGMYLVPPDSWHYDQETVLSIVITEASEEKTTWERFREFFESNKVLVVVGLGSAVVTGVALRVGRRKKD